ncbi:putative transcription factor GRAS family [Dioscorea sansibarensis]
MVMGTGIRGSMPSFKNDEFDFLIDPSSMNNGFSLRDEDESLLNPSALDDKVSGRESPDRYPDVFNDIVLNYISRMLMEEDMDEKLDIYHEPSALQAAEKSLYDVLGEKYPPSPDHPPLYTDSESPGTSTNPYSGHSSSQSSSFSSSNSFSNVTQGLEESLLLSMGWVPDISMDSFRKGVEEARKFLPSDDQLVITLENTSGFLSSSSSSSPPSVIQVKAEESHGSRGRKNPHSDDSEPDDQRSNKQSAVFYEEETVRTPMFDDVLLCKFNCVERAQALRAAVEVEREASKGVVQDEKQSKKTRGKKQTKKEVVDLRTLLIHCAQAVSADDRRNAGELLKQIRHHSSPHGDGTQRLAHCFANGLEARMAGTGSKIYNDFMSQRRSASDVLRAYQLYLSACPFKRISHFIANRTILDLAENQQRLHIVDFGIYYGFQWPCFMQTLAHRPGGPPKLRITGIEFPRRGFRPAELVEETGRRLTDYARSFNIPFEYNHIAAKWETIRVEDIKIEKDELLIVNCLYRLKSLADETVAADSPRDMVLNLIRRMNPDLFIQAITNGTYNAPFFVTRFREALFHFSALFDMLENNVPREDTQRFLIERDLFGRDALNVIACEGLERVERPETYKQWQARNLRAGFEQLPLTPELVRRAVSKRTC